VSSDGETEDLVSLLQTDVPMYKSKDGATGIDVVVRNEIARKQDSSCPACQTSKYVPDFTVSVWDKKGPNTIKTDKEFSLQVNMAMGGIGIQVNGFYFAYDPTTRALAKDLSTDPHNDQVFNPDNAGAQVYLRPDCSFQRVSLAWSAMAVPTYAIADLTSKKDGGKCKVTVKANDDTYRLSTFHGKAYHGFSAGSSSWVPGAAKNKVAAGCFLSADSYKSSWSSINFDPNTFEIGTTSGNVEAPTYSCKPLGLHKPSI